MGIIRTAVMLFILLKPSLAQSTKVYFQNLLGPEFQDNHGSQCCRPGHIMDSHIHPCDMSDIDVIGYFEKKSHTHVLDS